MKTRVILAALLIAACDDGPTASQRGGVLAVGATTVGGDLDTDGYRLIVGSERESAIGPQNTVVLSDISAGTHVLSLDGVAPNCVAAPASITIEVVAGETRSASFTVTCALTGVEVTVRTSGVDPPLGYSVKAGERTGSVPVNGSLVVSRLAPGNHAVSVAVNDNCVTSGSNAATVAVSNRALTPVNFDITCARTEKGITFARDTSFSQPVPTFLTSVLVASPSGASIVPLISGHGAAWSPDGKKVAFSQTVCDFYYYGACEGGLMIIDPETRSTSVVQNGNHGFDPSWSPDGKMLAFTQFSGNFIQISLLYVTALDGSLTVVLNPPGVNAEEPSWSPDGSRIVFRCYAVSGSGLGPRDICVINKDGTGFRHLTDDLAHDWDPAWSPDGTRIAFTTFRFPNSGPESSIALMAADGTGVTRLTTGFDPAWSPDGSMLVFGGTNGLFTINADGSNRTRLTTGSHRDPDWRK